MFITFTDGTQTKWYAGGRNHPVEKYPRKEIRDIQADGHELEYCLDILESFEVHVEVKTRVFIFNQEDSELIYRNL